MKVITLRNLPPELARKVRERARESGTSLTRAVVRLLEERLGLGQQQERPDGYDDLDGLAGKWSEKEAEEFDSALARQRSVDPDLWR